MTQTGYRGIDNPNANVAVTGGICRWYFVQKEYVELWSAIDPLTQYLASQPLLKSARPWLGPVKVPDHSLGFEETLQYDKPGLYYKQKVSGFIPGDSEINRVILENMPYYEYVIVGQLRGSGLYLILGNMDHGLTFAQAFKTNTKEGAGTEITFACDSLTKALILPTFNP